MDIHTYTNVCACTLIHTHTERDTYTHSQLSNHQLSESKVTGVQDIKTSENFYFRSKLLRECHNNEAGTPSNLKQICFYTNRILDPAQSDQTFKMDQNPQAQAAIEKCI